MSIKNELQFIISGNGSVRNGETIQAITSYFRRKKEAVSIASAGQFNKEEETKALFEYITTNNFWIREFDDTKYIGEGAEQKIYESPDPYFVVKLNDSIYYAFWEDYLNNLLLHNYFFPHLAYELIGFYMPGTTLFAIVKQPFVKSTENTNLQNIKDFLSANVFINKKANDYFHPGLGIILEDLHDENVLTNEGVLQFIDTVYYLTDEFYR